MQKWNDFKKAYNEDLNNNPSFFNMVYGTALYKLVESEEAFMKDLFVKDFSDSDFEGTRSEYILDILLDHCHLDLDIVEFLFDSYNSLITRLE